MTDHNIESFQGIELNKCYIGGNGITYNMTYFKSRNGHNYIHIYEKVWSHDLDSDPIHYNWVLLKALDVAIGIQMLELHNYIKDNKLELTGINVDYKDPDYAYGY